MVGVTQAFKIIVQAHGKRLVANKDTGFDVFPLCGFGCANDQITCGSRA